ncbi:MAG TPA: cbb3-type cytochrome c oxidase subunit I, partial [Methylomirabilota bacterium]
FLLGGLFMNASFLFNAAPNQGWYGYANLTSRQYSPGLNVDFWNMGLQVLGVASLAAAVNFFVTILNMRAPGMTLMRMPIFVWMTLITQVLLLLAFPVIAVALILLMFDRFFGTHFFVPTGGGDPLLWQHFFWIFGHPEVYILILPAFGIISEVLPVFSRKPLFGYAAMVFSGIFIAFLGFGVWSHHMFTTGMGPIADAAFAVATMLIAIPTGVKIFNWLATLWGGSIRFTVALHYAVGLVALFTIGGLSGIMHASPPVDLQQTDSYFVVAHLHYVLIGANLFPVFAAFYFWLPKMTGRMMSERLGRWSFGVMFLGFNVAFFPMHVTGLLGMPRRIFTYPEGLGWAGVNLTTTIGSFVLAVGILVSLWNLVASLRHGERAGANPWNADGLEWEPASPPPPYGSVSIPTVVSRNPLWDVHDESHDPHGERVLDEDRLTLTTSWLDARPIAVAKMPEDTATPFYLGLALAIGFTAVLLGNLWVTVGAAIASLAITAAWLWPERSRS